MPDKFGLVKLLAGVMLSHCQVTFSTSQQPEHNAFTTLVTLETQGNSTDQQHFVMKAVN